MPKRDKLMVELDAVSSRLFNAYAALANNGVDRKLLAKNKELKSENNKVCFICGTGPSLTKEIVESIAPYDTMTVNFFHKAYSDFEPTYHVFLDPAWEDGWAYDFGAEVKGKLIDTKFIVKQGLVSKWKSKGVDTSNTYIVNPCKVQYKDKLWYDMTKQMTNSINVIPFAIQCAVYMGYKKIYLLGCDFNSYAMQRYEHCYEGTKDELQKREATGELIRAAMVHSFHYALQKASKEIGCEIINLTEGSLIDAYKRDDLKRVISELQEA